MAVRVGGSRECHTQELHLALRCDTGNCWAVAAMKNAVNVFRERVN